MRVFGFEITRAKAQSVSSVGNGGWLSLIREPWGGAWQQNVAVDSGRDILAFSAVFACVTVIASDIAKLRLKLVEVDDNGIGTEIKTDSPFLRVLKRPNKYQNRIKFIEQWIVSKLLHGNTYVLKRRDARMMVRDLYVLDAKRVTPLVTESGEVYYELQIDHLSGLDVRVTVPATEIIHDSMVALFHPLVGVSPLYAAGLAATQGRKIQSNSTKFFDNMSRPSGVLTAPGRISDEVAGRMKREFEDNFSGNNIGRLLVGGDGLKYEAMTIPAEQAQLIEQLKWTVEDVARPFHVPLYKIGGPVPAGSTIDALNQAYYSECLQALLESAELALDEGLGLPIGYHTEFDLDGLLRMDQMAQIQVLGEGVTNGITSPNEARAKLNKKPVKGGDTPYLQQQNYSLAALAKRDAMEDPFATKPAPALPAPAAANDEDDEEDAEERAAEMADVFIRGLMQDMPAPVSDARLIDVDSQIRASVGIVSSLAAAVKDNAARVDATLDAVVSSAKHVEQAQRASAKSMKELADVLSSPVEPVFDENGMLKGARRVKKEEA